MQNRIEYSNFEQLSQNSRGHSWLWIFLFCPLIHIIGLFFIIALFLNMISANKSIPSLEFLGSKPAEILFGIMELIVLILYFILSRKKIKQSFFVLGISTMIMGWICLMASLLSYELINALSRSWRNTLIAFNGFLHDYALLFTIIYIILSVLFFSIFFAIGRVQDNIEVL